MYSVPKLDDYSPEALDRAVNELFLALDAETSALKNESDWKDFRDRWLARKNGVVTQVNDTWLKSAPGPAKREVGQRVNALKTRVEADVLKAQGRLLGLDDQLEKPGVHDSKAVTYAGKERLKPERLDV